MTEPIILGISRHLDTSVKKKCEKKKKSEKKKAWMIFKKKKKLVCVRVCDWFFY